ncbi:MAG: DinB family protein [Saprospiraceae bacterium]
MEFQKKRLLNDLKSDINKAIKAANDFKNLSIDQLNYKENTEKWSILECLEHVSLYGDFYLKEIESSILKGKISTTTTFKSGFFGNYFAKSMQPKTDGTIPNKMKTFKDKNPANSNLPITVIDRFIKQQKQMLTLLEQAEKVDLKAIKTKTTLPVIKFRLGDTFRFVIYHINRHILQAKKIQIPVV